MSDRPEGYPPTPELDRMLEVKPQSQKIGEFLEWLEEQGIVLCKPCPESFGYFEYERHHESINSMLARYFEIDLKKIDAEQTAVLAWVRAEHNRSA